MSLSISLIGMAGAGKSSIASELASKLDFKTIDSDKMIEQSQDLSLQGILDLVGYERFKRIEEEILLSVDFNKIILSTGGSAVYSQKAMEYLMQNSKVFFLEVPLNIILERVENFSQRGFIKSPDQTISDVFEEREYLYKKYCHHVIDNSFDVSNGVSQILELC